jgi:hypothetical protein
MLGRAFAIIALLASSAAVAQTTLVDKLTRISLALRGGTLPSPELVTKAQSDPASVDLAAVVDEWLATPEFMTNMEIWHKQVFRTPYLERSDMELLDFAPAGLREALADEPVRMALFVIQNDMPYSTLLDSKLAMRNSVLSRFYANEDPTGAATDDWRPVWRDEKEMGVLTMKAMHLRNPTTVVNRWRTHANQVMQQWSCQTLEAVNVVAKEDDDAHGTDPNCVSCHRPLDGLGTFFSRWDRYGNFDNDADIDDRGTFYETSNLTHTGNGLVALGQILADSRRFAQCMVDKSWTFLAGRAMTEAETKARSDFLQAFWQSDYSMKSLLKTIVLSDAFLDAQ